ncbi:hypothetical protein [Pendulispora albinea]|uniref:Uncharacterized protein n=1 Tax=Pendulispora albinea TaxID=2741071 RepID=A0ABZ2LLB3_9BACT
MSRPGAKAGGRIVGSLQKKEWRQLRHRSRVKDHIARLGLVEKGYQALPAERISDDALRRSSRYADVRPARDLESGQGALRDGVRYAAPITGESMLERMRARLLRALDAQQRITVKDGVVNAGRRAENLAIEIPNRRDSGAAR